MSYKLSREIMTRSLVIGQPIQQRYQETIYQCHQQKFILVLHHPQHWTQQRHPSLYLVEVVLLTLQVLVKLVLVFYQGLYLLVTSQSVHTYLELLPHVLGYLLSYWQLRKIYLNDLAFQINFNRSCLLLEEQESIVVCMEIVLHFLSHLLILQ